jgi:SAM-dependent methyltransferase
MLDSVGTTIGADNHAAWRRTWTAHAYRHASSLFPAESAILDLLKEDVAAAHLLDIGIGTGRTTGHLARRCAAYIGVDYSPEMIERAKSRFPEESLRVMDARNLGVFAEGRFDIVVFSYNGIDYVGHQDRLTILGQIHRVLRRGGLFVFSAHRLGVDIPAATDPGHLKLSLNPARTAQSVVRYVQGIRNAARIKPNERREADYALLNDAAQQYQLLTYYISPAAQRRQLESIGFQNVRAFAQTGAEIGIDAPALPAHEPDYMVHYIAERR